MRITAGGNINNGACDLRMISDRKNKYDYSGQRR
jgi:hypothetical protein